MIERSILLGEENDVIDGQRRVKCGSHAFIGVEGNRTGAATSARSGPLCQVRVRVRGGAQSYLGSGRESGAACTSATNAGRIAGYCAGTRSG